MKKNLIFLTFLISVLMVSVVSASVTGYLVRGTAVQDSGYTATLQKVSAGVATVNVQTPSGATETVQVQEGETTTVGDAQISASGLKSGTLFRRGGANVEINVVPDVSSEEEEEKVCYNYANDQSFVVNGQEVILVINADGSFYFTDTDGKPLTNVFESDWTGSLNLLGGTINIKGRVYEGPGIADVITICIDKKPTEETDHWHVINPQQITKYDPAVAGTQTILGEKVLNSNNQVVGTLFQKKLECPGKRILVDGGFVINHAGGAAYPYPDNYVVLENAPVDVNTYLVKIFQSASANTKIASVTLEMICAQLEPAVNAETAHFPFLES